MVSPVLPRESPTADAAAAPGAGGDEGAAGDVAMLRRSALAACLTCPLCGCLLRDAATITECLHTFCRKCISEEFISKEVCRCPICSIDLGCAPLEKLRVDRSLQYVRSKVFPFTSKKQRVEGPEVTSPIPSPTETANLGTSSAPDGQASEAATAGATVGTEPSQAQVGGDLHAWEGSWIPAASLVALDDVFRTGMRALCDMSPILESLRSRSMEKSMIIRHLWDRLAEETQLREGLAQQLDAARREVAELAPLGRDLASLRIKEADAREHAREAEVKTRAHAAESERLRKERDELLWAVEELRAERDSARQERADAQEWIDRLEVELEEERDLKVGAQCEVRKLSDQVNGLDDRLAAEMVKNRCLEKELAEVKDLLSKERDEHDALRVAVGVVCDDLKMIPEQGSSSVATRTAQITERAREMARNALHFGVHRSFARMVEEMEKMVAPLALELAGKLEDEVVTQRG